MLPVNNSLSSLSEHHDSIRVRCLQGPKLSVDDLDMKDKNVIVRVDFNVPMKDGMHYSSVEPPKCLET